MTNITENQAREQLVQAARLLFQTGVMSHSGHGNMSFRLPETEHMLLTSALAHQPLPCAYEALLRFGVTEDIPVADWAPRGSQESAANIVKQIEQHPTVPAVLLGNHGLLAFGHDALYAAMVIISMEEAAELTLAARTLGGEKRFPAGAL